MKSIQLSDREWTSGELKRIWRWWGVRNIDLRRGGTADWHLVLPAQNSAFNIPVVGDNYPHRNVWSALERLRKKDFYVYHLKLLTIIGDISNVPSTVLLEIDRRLRFWHNESIPFGGVSVIVLDDFYQLPPTKGSFVCGDSSLFCRSAIAFRAISTSSKYATASRPRVWRSSFWSARWCSHSDSIAWWECCKRFLLRIWWRDEVVHNAVSRVPSSSLEMMEFYFFTPMVAFVVLEAYL